MSRIRTSVEVGATLARGGPVVALESTVLSHGLPRPDNLRVGRDLERLVRADGALPATIAVLDGVPTVGLSDAQMERIASDPSVDKLSTRDLPVACARGRTGGTTVAATAHLAKSAGIAVFATGGVGGVHRGQPLDVSADLAELARTPILVVCAGAKSILDLSATREALETAGVLVVGWRTDRFPAFYTPATDLTVDVRVEDAAEVAAIWTAHLELAVGSAILVCAPVPEADSIPEQRLEQELARALEAAEEGDIRGKDITPFLLRELATTTGGASLQANISLLRNNARIAAEIAVALTSFSR